MQPIHPSAALGTSGGEGDRTPDLVNAIHALSQLSYAPITFSDAATIGRSAAGRQPIRRGKSCQANSVHLLRSVLYPCHDSVPMKHSDPADPPPRTGTVSAVTLRHYPDDLSVAEILAAEAPPARKPRKRDTSRSLGVYDADSDILDQYLFEVSRTPLLTVSQEVAIARRVRRGDADAMRELVTPQPALRHLGGQEVPEPRHGAHRPDRRGKPRPDDGREEVRSRSGRQVHLLCGLVDSPVDPGVAGAPGPHRACAAQSHRRPVAHHARRRGVAPGTAAANRRPRSWRGRPVSPSTSCRRCRRSTPPRSGSTHPSIPTAIDR